VVGWARSAEGDCVTGASSPWSGDDQSASISLEVRSTNSAMKRTDLIRHLARSGCELLREGSNHSLWVNRPARKSTAVPRHRQIKEFLARKICDDLQITRPR